MIQDEPGGPPAGRFRELCLSGGARERGLQHGEQLAGPIAEVLEFYRGLWGLDLESLEAAGQAYAKVIRRFRADLAEEIEAIALAANQPPWLLHALNSRSEIFNNARIAADRDLGVAAECTVVFDARHALLAQNWDWSRFLLPRIIDCRVETETGERLRTLTEPGILAKIGMNRHGLGVGLNILATRRRLQGVPVHVLLRALLECHSLEQAQALATEQAVGKASHLLLAQADGRCIGIEFAGEEFTLLEARDGVLAHTNHYLSDESLNDAEVFTSTRPRMETARAHCLQHGQGGDEAWVGELLSEQASGENSVCKPWSEAGIRGFGEVGTVFTVIMDLAARRLSIRMGSAPGAPFYSVSV